ncbi:protein PHYTOCHROME KINASE SUBSTRATE 4-like [Nicotiana tabacum]|uniref:Protein PHYTOCHROME KINASE SUBSTRATE 4-like n=2 Tax=Nicotiana TaxID=4085 RepID=A0A1S3Z9E3_TOBAC|nr:PREDICTED: protein PHYTOCHROME KINASE SUBSTRATE 4 [Nicotiana sylvestris]XP_016461036.1 PREDICTED: protein PHYTOCHROME KINASE SUBSTRATE 4-like [Nicotiana tabacum]
MDSPTTVKTLNYKSSQNPAILGAPEHPLKYRCFVQNHILKDASFSSYLKPKEHIPEDSEIKVFEAKKYFSESNDSSPETQKNLADQSELASVPRVSSVSSVDNGYGRNFRANSFRATPTASSEASWNSQTGLLSHPPGAIAVSLRSTPNEEKRGSFSTRKWFFCRKCPCSGKKSVQVEETNSEPRTETGTEHFAVKHNHRVLEKAANMSQKNSTEIQQRAAILNSNGHLQRPQPSQAHVAPLETINKIGTIQKRLSESETHVTPSTIACQQRVLASVRPFTETAGGFSFPILNQSAQAKLGIKPPPTMSISPILEDPARDSLEVFQPSSRKSTECNFPFPGSPISRVTATDDDVASDASSDLFEIESFSTSIATSCPMYRQRNSLDEPATPSVAATECYAPSEVSIDWSVTTAEGFDRASITNYSSISEIDNMSNMRLFSGGGGSGSGGDGGKWKGSGLLSCRHEKAVNVGPKPVKFASAEGPPLPLISAAGHVSSRAVARANNKPPIASSHSARLSLAFAA